MASNGDDAPRGRPADWERFLGAALDATVPLLNLPPHLAEARGDFARSHQRKSEQTRQSDVRAVTRRQQRAA
jgi:hypothetical protein